MIGDSFSAERRRIRSGGLRGAELLAWLVAMPPDERDDRVEELLGIRHEPHQPSGQRSSVDGDFVPYTPSGIAPVVRAVFDVPVTSRDVFIDLGSGLGKVAMAVHLLSGARTRGVEMDPDLATRARSSAARLGLDDVSFVTADARDADVHDGTVFFLYLPFTGAVLAAVMDRLRAVAEERSIVVCALGFDLRGVEWLSARETDAFWLSIYDSRPGNARPRVESPLPLAGAAEAIALERALATEP